MSSQTTASPLFLGLDLSTQQLKAVLIKEDATIVHENSVHFSNDLSHFNTTNGTYHGPGEGEVTSPVAMWLEAIDLLFERMHKENVSFSDILAISGAGQQHGSVYWSTKAESLLSNLDPTKSLTEQLSPDAFSLDKSPIWQDHSTEEDCARLEKEIGGPQALADLSGSRAYERFTGSQISKIRRLKPEVYEATSKISLVSSFIASVFLGAFAPIEVSDASGMNLTNILTGKWDDRLLDICGGPELRSKLGSEPVLGGVNLGKVSSWWVKRWGLNPECIVAPFVGDNPATVMSLSSPGDAVLSLGTSTTFLLSVPPSDIAPKRFTTSHLLAHPTSSNGHIVMLCYKNGALARENVRDKYADKHWTKFNELVQATPAGCDGYLALYFPLPEIIPPGVQGEHCFSYNVADPAKEAPKPIDDVPPNVHCRAILESQFLSIRSRIAAILPPNAPHLRRLVISGGSSANPVIRQIAADIFDMNVYVSTTKEAAGMGGALLAKYAWWKIKNPKGAFEDMTGGEAVGNSRVAEPKKEQSQVYDRLVPVYTACEEAVVAASASGSLLALSAFRLHTIRNAALPTCIAPRTSTPRLYYFDLEQKRTMSELAPSRKRPLDELEREDVSEASTSKFQKSETDAGEKQGSEDVQMKDATTSKADEGHSDGGNSDSEQHSEAGEGTQQQKGAKKTESGRPRRKKKRGDQDESGASEGPKKRQPRNRRRATKEEEDAAKERKAQAEALGIPSAPRYPKRQSALLIGFCGSGYSGMQIQPDNIKTIEGVLFKALVNAGAVSQDNADDPVKVSLARAARTDAGVHAAGNVVSLKMIITVPGVKDLVARINEELPPEIRLWGFVRVQNSFNARLVCDSRKYTYYFPSYLLIPPKPGSGLYDKLRGTEDPTECPEVETSPIHSFWRESATSSHEEDLARKRAWRVGSADMERLRETVKKYEASHNFHNFTVGREFRDRSNIRFMKEIRVDDPVVHGDTEWISVLFHGQSFMLHQIRKMMAALVLTCRTGSSPEIIDELYKAPMVFIPKMPSLGLLLEEPLFNSYNGRMTVQNQNFKPTDADYRPLIDFELHREKIEAFKGEFIYKNMRGIEDRSGLFDAWVRSVDKYSGNDLLWLNREGKVPQECVIVKGQRRNNPFREKRVFDTTSFPSTAIVKKQLLEEAEAAEEDEEEEEILDKKHLAETEG